MVHYSIRKHPAKCGVFFYQVLLILSGSIHQGVMAWAEKRAMMGL